MLSTVEVQSGGWVGGGKSAVVEAIFGESINQGCVGRNSENN